MIYATAGNLFKTWKLWQGLASFITFIYHELRTNYCIIVFVIHTLFQIYVLRFFVKLAVLPNISLYS